MLAVCLLQACFHSDISAVVLVLVLGLALILKGFRANRSDTGLMLKTSVFQMSNGGNSTLMNLFDKTNFCFTLQLTPHHNFFGN